MRVIIYGFVLKAKEVPVMKELFAYAQKYKEEMNLLDLSLFKVCLVSMGVLIGLSVPKSKKKKVAAVSSVLFTFTYAPLVTKFLCTVMEVDKEEKKET